MLLFSAFLFGGQPSAEDWENGAPKKNLVCLLQRFTEDIGEGDDNRGAIGIPGNKLSQRNDIRYVLYLGAKVYQAIQTF